MTVEDDAPHDSPTRAAMRADERQDADGDRMTSTGDSAKAQSDAAAPSPPASLDVHGLTPPAIPNLDIRAQLAKARAQTGRGRLEMLREFRPLMRAPNKLMLAEYLGYRLFDRAAVPADELHRFVGFLGQRALNRRLNRGSKPPGLWGDKLLFDALMRGAGLATPPIQAVYHPVPAPNPASGPAGGPARLTSAADIARFLRREARYPLFGKPVRGEQSRGVVSFDAYDPASDRLARYEGGALRTDDFARMVAEEAALDGYLFQDRLAPHPDTADVSAGGLNTVRLVTMRGRGAPEILYAVWKVAAVGAPTDDGLYPGALKVWIDPDTGETLRAQKGAWMDRLILTEHPQTGAPLLGRRIPCWDDARAMVLAAAALTPSYRVLGFDLAITPHGPVLVEGNGDPGHRVAQTASGRGVLTDRVRALIAEAEADIAERDRAEKDLKRRRRRAFARAVGGAFAREFFRLPWPK